MVRPSGRLTTAVPSLVPFTTGAGSGLGDRIVDTNVIPVGLIQRVDVVQGGGAAVYVVKTLDRQPADLSGFDAQKAELEKQMLEQKRNQVWDAWVRAHRNSTKVEVAGRMVPATRY